MFGYNATCIKIVFVLYLFNVFATLLYLKVGGDTKGYEGPPSTGNKGLTSLTISPILQMYLTCLSSSAVVDFFHIIILLHFFTPFLFFLLIYAQILRNKEDLEKAFPQCKLDDFEIF